MEAVTLLRHFLNLIQALMLPLEVGRWDLAQPCQEALLAFGVIEKGCKSSVLHDEVMHLLAASDAALPGLEPPQERLHLVVGTRQPGDLVAGGQASPTVTKRAVDMGCHLLVPGITAVSHACQQLAQVAVDSFSNGSTAGGWFLTLSVKQPIQINQPLSLTDQLFPLGDKRQAQIHDPDQTVQRAAPPFCRQRCRKPASALKSSKSRTPARAKGAVPPSSRIERMAAA